MEGESRMRRIVMRRFRNNCNNVISHLKELPWTRKMGLNENSRN